MKLFWPNEWIWRNGFGEMDEFGEMDFGQMGFGEIDFGQMMDLAKWIW